tara:strand:+ start:184 stop:393 length:210 start_codon:yes stop_codon:yes gene_type:complete
MVSELVKCNDDDPDAVDEGPDPESFDDVFELHQKATENKEPGSAGMSRKSVSGTHKEIIHVDITNMKDL